MDLKNREHFKNKLLSQKKDVEMLLQQMEDNDTINSNMGLEDELSNYDNHPADLGGNLYEKEKGIALKEHEITIIKKIDDALRNIEGGSYGKCKGCGKEILKERLEFIPYAQYCTKCQNEINTASVAKQRPIEEEVLKTPFGYGYNDLTDKVGFDAEDSYQSVERFNEPYNSYSSVKYYNYGDFDENEDEIGYVEPIERISNDQYKNQLPD